MIIKKENILIAGANGTTGRIIVELLKESAVYKPIAMVRKQDQKDRFEQENVEVVLADLEEDVSHAVENIDKVIFAAGSNGKNVKGVDQEGAKRLIDASKIAKVKKFVMLSTMGADNPSASDSLEDYFRAKQKADDYLKASELNYSIVRPGTLTDKDATGKIKLKEKLDEQGSITRADVAQTLVELLKEDVKHNQFFEMIAGEIPIKKALETS